jgi:hypothetical protein
MCKSVRNPWFRVSLTHLHGQSVRDPVDLIPLRTALIHIDTKYQQRTRATWKTGWRLRWLGLQVVYVLAVGSMVDLRGTMMSTHGFISQSLLNYMLNWHECTFSNVWQGRTAELTWWSKLTARQVLQSFWCVDGRLYCSAPTNEIPIKTRQSLMGEQLTFEATYSIQYTYIIYSYIYIHVYRKACCGRATKHDIFPNIFHGLKKYWLFAVYTQAFSSGNRA